MVKDQLDPQQTAQQIANQYLSQRNWSKEWRGILNEQLNPGMTRERFDNAQRECDQKETAAEDYLNSQFETWRTSAHPQALEVVKALYQILGQRNDLGFYARRIMGFIKRNYFPA